MLERLEECAAALEGAKAEAPEASKAVTPRANFIFKNTRVVNRSVAKRMVNCRGSMMRRSFLREHPS